MTTPDTAGLIARLRAYVESADYISAEPLCTEAAAELERLRAQVAPAGYVTAIEEGKTLMLPRASLNTAGLVAVYTGAPAQQAAHETVPWPTVTRYLGGGSAEGVAGRMWVKLEDEGPDVEFVRAGAAQQAEPTCRQCDRPGCAATCGFHDYGSPQPSDQHSCHDGCSRPGCVDARAQQAEPVAWCKPGPTGKVWFGEAWQATPVKTAEATMALYSRPQAQPSAQRIDEREAFDAWAAADGGNVTRRADNTERYGSATVQGWWKAWQARAAQSPAAQGVGLTDEQIAEGCAEAGKLARSRDPEEAFALGARWAETALARAPAAEPAKLWLWKNFVEGRPEYWAFDNPFPIHMDCGDPQTLGEPCGYAIFKPSRQGRTDVPETEVLRRICEAKPA